MKKRHYESEGLYRFKIIAPLVNEVIPRGELRKRFRVLARKFYEHPERGWERFSHRTIEEWYYDYRSKGMAGLERKTRSDRGQSRSIPEEVGKLILDMKKENPNRSARHILKELVLAGVTQRGEISPSSVYRLLGGHRKELKEYQRETKEKRKYAFAFSNECWQSDVCHGPYLNIKGYAKKKKIFLYAFIDDASRIIPHAGAALSENLENFLHFLKIAIQKKGIPDRLYLDNASYYRSPHVQLVGARLGMKVIYCTPYSPYKKGKIERWWRTCRAQFLSFLKKDRHYSLKELNALLSTWVEKDYHHTKHSSLKTTPIEAWKEKGKRLRYPEQKQLEKDFLTEEERKIRNDGTISLNSMFYEVDSTLSGELVTVRYDSFRKGKRVFVYWRDELLTEAYPVNEVENRFSGRRKEIEKRQDVSTGINFLDLLKSEED